MDLTSPAIPGSGDTDGVDLSSLSDGSYNILVRDQSNNKVENGVYIFTKNSGSGTWARPSSEPMNNGFDANAAFSFVASGTKYGKVGLVQILNPAIVGTNELEYTEFYQLQVNAGEGLNTTIQSTELYINVDTSLNIVEYLDNNAGDLHLGAGDTTGNVVIGKENSSQTTTIQNQANFVQNDITVSSGKQKVQIGSGPNDLQNIRIGTGLNNPVVPDGVNNIAIGYNVLTNLTTADRNTFCGISSGTKITVSRNNTGFGLYTLQNYNGTGDDKFNTAIGAEAGRNVTNGSDNTFLGAGTDFDRSDAGYRNSTAIGRGAKITDFNQIMMGTANETVEVPGNLNVINGQATFNGHYYGIAGANGDNTNTVIGKVEIPSVDVSSNHSNVFIGNNILKKHSGRIQNVAIGNGALENGGTKVDKTVAIGYEALKNFRAGDTDPRNNDEPGTSSVAVGHRAGLNCKDCTYCTFLGTGADVDNSGVSYNYSTAIGRGAKITDSNQIMMGTATENVQVPGTLSYQSFRQPIIFNCQIKRDNTRTTNDGYYMVNYYGFNIDVGFYANYARVNVQCYAKQGPPNELDKYYNVLVSGRTRTEASPREYSITPFQIDDALVANKNQSQFQIRLEDELNGDDTGIIYVTVFYYPPL